MSWRNGNQRPPASTAAHSSQKSWVNTDDIGQVHEWVPGVIPRKCDFHRYSEYSTIIFKNTNDRVQGLLVFYLSPMSSVNGSILVLGGADNSIL